MYRGISAFPKQKKKSQQREIENRIIFKRNMNVLEAGEKNLLKTAQLQKQNAIEAEKNGDHATALRFAMEAQRLEKQARVTGDMKNTTLTAHAMSENTRALANMMQSVNMIAESSNMPDTGEMIGMQVQMEAIRENMDMMMETSGETLDQLTNTAGSMEREAGEEILRDLMKEEERKKHKDLLKETGKKLDALTRFREKE